MRFMFSLLSVILALLLAVSNGRAENSLTVFAAASLQNVLTEAADGYPDRIVFSYGGSGQIARQVVAGAPADIVILANNAWMDWLEEQQVTVSHSRREFFGNQLVLVGPAGSDEITDLTAEDLLSRLAGGRLAIGHTEGVPAGIYGRQWLETSGMWGAIKPHLAQVENVRAALALVSRGEAPLGVVYATDALADPTVDIVYRVNPTMHDPISYPLAVVKGAHEAGAHEFVRFLSLPIQVSVFRKHGFSVIGDSQ